MEGSIMAHTGGISGAGKRRVLVKFKLGIHKDVAKKYLAGLDAFCIEDGERDGTYVVTVDSERAAAWARRCAASPMVSLVTLST